MGMLTGNQKQTVNQFQMKNKQQQAEELARIANERGLSKDDLQKIVNMLNKFKG